MSLTRRGLLGLVAGLPFALRGLELEETRLERYRRLVVEQEAKMLADFEEQTAKYRRRFIHGEWPADTVVDPLTPREHVLYFDSWSPLVAGHARRT